MKQWISSPPNLFLGAFTRRVTCEGDSDGSYDVFVFGGTPPFTFLWSDGATVQNRTNIGRGVYTVTVTDSKGCSRSNGAMGRTEVLR